MGRDCVCMVRTSIRHHCNTNNYNKSAEKELICRIAALWGEIQAQSSGREQHLFTSSGCLQLRITRKKEVRCDIISMLYL